MAEAEECLSCIITVGDEQLPPPRPDLYRWGPNENRLL